MSEPIIHIPSLQKLNDVRGNIGAAFPFMALGIPPLDVVVWDDDFLGDAVSSTYEVVTGVDGAINILADQENGVAEIRASDGNGGDNEYAGISLPELAFSGDKFCGMAARIALDTLATAKVEVGFTDVTTDAGAVNNLGTPTATADDAAVWCYDTDDTAYWQSFAVNGGGTPQKIEGGLAPTAATFEWLIVIIQANAAKFYRLDVNSNLTYESAWIADAIEGGTQICPWIFVQLRTGTIDRNVQLDRLIAWGNRTTG